MSSEHTMPEYVHKDEMQYELEVRGVSTEGLNEAVLRSVFKLFTLYALYVHPDTTHFLSRFTMFVRILRNILGSTVAQQSVVQDVWH
jgi:hypothetical protein